MAGMNLDAILKITAQVAGQANVDRLAGSLVKMESTAKAAKTTFKDVINSSAFQAAAVAAAGVAVAIGSSVNEAVKFESAMADVRKVVDGLDNAAEFDAMKRAIIDLSRVLPVSAEGLTQIVAAAGQAGIAKDELLGFAESAAKMGVAFDITADQAGEAMAKMRTSMGLSQQEVEQLADAMNYLSNVQASSAGQITDFMLRVGAFGQQVAMTEEQTAALGSAMIAAGAAPEVAATSFRNLIKEMAAGVNATDKQEEAWSRLGLTAVDVAKMMQEDAVGTIRDVFQRISELPAEVQIPTIEVLFGNEARALTPLIKNMKLFDESIAAVGDSSKYTGSMLKEFEARSATTANQFLLLQNNVKALQIEIGSALLPAINGLMSIVTPVVALISRAASVFPPLTAAVVGLAAAFAGLVLALPFIASALSIVSSLSAMGVTLAGVGAAIAGIGATIAGWAGAVVPALTVVLGALKGLGAVLVGVFTGPVGWVALLAAAVVALVAFREPVMAFFSWLGGQLQQWIASLWQWGEPIRQFWIGLWESVKQVTLGFVAWLSTAFSRNILQPIQQALAPVVGFFAAAFQQVQQVVGGFFSWWGTNLYKALIEPLVSLLSGLGTMFGNAFRSAQQAVVSGFSAITQAFQSNVIRPLLGAWSDMLLTLGQSWQLVADGFNAAVVDPIRNAWQGLMTFLQNIVQGAVTAVSRAFQSIAGAVTGAFRGIVGSVGRVINSVINAINTLIAGVNKIRASVGLSGFSLIPTVSLPTFAEGGVVKRPTVALVGEGGEPEYIIPESKMGAAAANYLTGARGDAVLNSVPAGVMAAAPSRVASGGGVPAISITTGPVVEFDGRRYVTVEDLQSAARQTATQIYATLRTPAGRRAIGVG